MITGATVPSLYGKGAPVALLALEHVQLAAIRDVRVS